MKNLKYLGFAFLILLLFASCATKSVASEDVSEDPVATESKALAEMESGNPDGMEVMPPPLEGMRLEGFDPALMAMQEGFGGRREMPGMFDGAGGFSVTPAEPISFTVDEDDLLYDISIKSVSSPMIPETFYDAEDILNLEEYEIISIILDGPDFIASSLAEGISVLNDGEVLLIENTTADKYCFYLEGEREGTIRIESDKADYALILNEVSLKGKSLPALQLKGDSKAFIYSAEGSFNRIEDSKDNEKKGVVTADGDVIFSGKGEIEIYAFKKHGLKVDGTVRVVSGDLYFICDEQCEGNGISVDDAYIQDAGDVRILANGSVQGEESKGIKVNGREGEDAKGYLVINGGTITIDSVGKALTAGFEAEEDGETESVEDDPIPNVYVNNGVVKINTTGEIYELSDELSLSPEGIEAKNDLIINGGLIEICATDDALNAGGMIIINSGSLLAHSKAADAIDSNTAVEINGGAIVALGSMMPEMAIDCDSNNRFTYNGGYVVALSGAGSQLPGSSESTGYAFSIGQSFAPGESIALTASDGNVLLAFKVPENYDRATSGMIAASGINKGVKYSLLRGAEVEADYFFNGMYLSNITASGGEESGSAIAESRVTSLGSGADNRQMGGFGGNRMMSPDGFDPKAMRNEADWGGMRPVGGF